MEGLQLGESSSRIWVVLALNQLCLHQLEQQQVIQWIKQTPRKQKPLIQPTETPPEIATGISHNMTHKISILKVQMKILVSVLV